MIYNIIKLLLLGHILGDFYFQSEKLVLKKREKIIKGVFEHSIIYGICIILCSLPAANITSKINVVVILLLIISHLIIDLVKSIYIKFVSQRRSISYSKIFILDQVIHLICIACAANYITYSNNIASFKPFAPLMNLFANLQINSSEFISVCLLFLLNAKPTNILIKEFFKYRPEKNQIEKRGNGRIIGTLERWIIIIFLMIGQYASVGLILTAKSIVRYDQIKGNESNFGEYYLLGTLISILMAMVSVFIVSIILTK